MTIIIQAVQVLTDHCQHILNTCVVNNCVHLLFQLEYIFQEFFDLRHFLVEEVA